MREPLRTAFEPLPSLRSKSATGALGRAGTGTATWHGSLPEPPDLDRASPLRTAAANLAVLQAAPLCATGWPVAADPPERPRSPSTAQLLDCPALSS